jgi:hypothetical protein
MKLFFDLRLGYLVQFPGGESALSSVDAKAGDTEEIILQFGRSADPTGGGSIIEAAAWEAENMPGGTVIRAAVKKAGEYSDGDLLASVSTWTNDAGEKTYTANLNLNTDQINLLLARGYDDGETDEPSAECGFEITFQRGGSGGWRSSVLPVTLTLYHDLIFGDEGTPTNADDPDEYALKSTVVEWLPTIIYIDVGDGPGGLTGIPTVDLTLYKTVEFFDSEAGIVRRYRLEFGTAANDLPDVVRPLDYNATTNAKYWELVAFATGSLGGTSGSTANAILRADGTGGNLVKTSGITIADGASGNLAGTNSGDVTLGSSLTDVLSLTTQLLAAVSAGSDKIIFWDHSASKFTFLTVGSGLAITDTTIAATGSGGMTNPMTTAHDIIVGGTAGAPARLAKGSEGNVLSISSGAVAWAAPSGGMANPMTTSQDLIVGGSSGTPGRLGVGSNGAVLGVSSGSISWVTPSTAGGPTATVTKTSGGILSTDYGKIVRIAPTEEIIIQLEDKALGTQIWIYSGNSDYNIEIDAVTALVWNTSTPPILIGSGGGSNIGRVFHCYSTGGGNWVVIGTS